MVSTIERFHCIQDSQLGPSGVLYREVPPYNITHTIPGGCFTLVVTSNSGHIHTIKERIVHHGCNTAKQLLNQPTDMCN